MKSRFLASTVSLLAVLAAVSPSAQDRRQRSAELVLGVDLTGMDRSARPQDDFFRFVNGAWADRTPIPSELSSYGSFAMLREQAVEDVNNILREAAASP